MAYLIESVESLGEFKLWYRVGCAGYTANIDAAGRFSAAEAVNRCFSGRHKMVLEEEVESRSIRVVANERRDVEKELTAASIDDVEPYAIDDGCEEPACQTCHGEGVVDSVAEASGRWGWDSEEPGTCPNCGGSGLRKDQKVF